MKTILCFMALSFSLFASELIESDDLWIAAKKAEGLVKKHGASKVLFASDLDNTLLKTNQDLASEPWFNWQDSLLKDPKSEFRIACDIQDLLFLFRTTISLSQVSPVQEDQAKAIQWMQKLGTATIAITARGESTSNATFTQLSSNGLDFSKFNLAGEGFAAPYLPWDLNRPETSGLTSQEVAQWNLTAARPVVFQRGVLFSDGQNKGALLRTLIHKTKKDIRAVVFWDNDKKNTQRVFDAFENSGIEVVSIRASRQDKDIQRFNDSDKTRVTQDYLQLRKLLDHTYGYPRTCVLPIDRH